MIENAAECRTNSLGYLDISKFLEKIVLCKSVRILYLISLLSIYICGEGMQYRIIELQITLTYNCE